MAQYATELNESYNRHSENVIIIKTVVNILKTWLLNSAILFFAKVTDHF